jgi:vancomycin permeability regulator SanA
MSLEKQIVVDLIEVAENGSVQVRTKTVILENSIPITSSFHRHAIAPGQDYSQEDERVKAICQAVHTPEMVAAFQAKMQEELKKLGALNDHAI